MRSHLRYAVSLIVAGIAIVAAVVPSAAMGNNGGGETVANARDATAAFNDPAAAYAAGYDLLTDAEDMACIDMQPDGAMGVHLVKGALVQSGNLDAARPQALVYERDNGQLRLAAVEYVVFKSAWDSAHTAPPTLFGQQFVTNPDDNRFGLPAFYSLHAWVWKDNPSGMFQSWNPAVHCA
ncbi:MAG TPA: hypothetical protein VGJ60_21885 [Chloroflexota bacterium]|jgi:hypothetical protein